MTFLEVRRPRAQGYGCLIGDKYFRVAPSAAAPINTYTQDSLAPRQDDSGKAGENVLELGYAFGRQNLTGGEGLDWWPRPAGEPNQEFDIIRFWDSSDIDIRRPEAGEPYSSKLSKDYTTFWDPTGSPLDMGASRDAVYIIEGQNVHRFDNWSDDTPEDTDDLGEALVNMEVGIDDTVVVTGTSGDVWIKPHDSDVYVKVYDSSTDGPPALAAWWVKGRIILTAKDAAVAGEGIMVEVAPGVGGTPAAPTVDPSIAVIDTFAGDMTDCLDAGYAIIASFTDGSIRSYVNQSDSAGGIPILTVRATTQMPRHEFAISLGWNLGTLMVYTLEEAPTGGNVIARLYSATVLDERFEFAVGGLQVLREWNGADETSPAFTKNVVTSRDEAFITVGEAIGWSIWRYDFVTGGVFRHQTTANDGLRGLTLFDGRLAYICATSDTIRLESADTYKPTGYLITPNITFGLNTPINWTAFVLEALELAPPGSHIEFYQSIDPDAIKNPNHSSWQLIENYTDQTQSGIEKPTVNIEANQLALQVKWFASSDLMSSPDLKRFAVRGLPEHRDWVVEVPINVSDLVTAPNRMPLRVPHLGDKNHRDLLELQGKATTFQLYDPPLTIRGIVEALSEPVRYQTPRGSVGQYCMVRFLGKLLGAEELSSVQGSAGMGIALSGVSTMGIDEVGVT